MEVFGDDGHGRKPDPGPLVYAVSQLGCMMSDVVYFGDTDVDVIAAESCGIEVYLFPWSHAKGYERYRLNNLAALRHACTARQRKIGGGMEIWAHRGCHGYDQLLENTLPAFQRAIDDGVDGIELDVHISADGVPFVYHDDCLRRLSVGGRRAPVAALAMSDLTTVQLQGEQNSLTRRGFEAYRRDGRG